MAREEGTYILLVDVFNGQDTLFFPLFYHTVKHTCWDLKKTVVLAWAIQYLILEFLMKKKSLRRLQKCLLLYLDIRNTGVITD